MNKDGIIVAFEGADRIGKHTQAQLFTRWLDDNSQSFGYKGAKLYSFPSYDEPQGQYVASYLREGLNTHLRGSLGEIQASPLEAAMLFAFDRSVTYRTSIQPWIQEGGIAVVDRWVESNVAYGVAKQRITQSEEDSVTYLKFRLRQLEYNILHLPLADVTFLLTLDHDHHEDTLKSIRQHEELDIHEKNDALMYAVHAEYERIASEYGSARRLWSSTTGQWHIIDQVKENGERKTIGEVENEIASKFRQLMGPLSSTDPDHE